MDKLTLSLLIGLGIAILDIIPMLIQRLPAYSTIASFIHYFVATVLIMNVDLPFLPWWLKGGVLGLALMTPMLIHVGHSDKKPLPIIAINAVLWGTVAGVLAYFI